MSEQKKSFWDSKWAAAIVYTLIILAAISSCTSKGPHTDTRDGDDPFYD